MVTMRAAVLYAPGDLRIEQIPVPRISRNQVLVNVKAVGICGSDLHLYNNGRIADSIMNEPLILGHEAAGEIVAIGEDVTALQCGDRVVMEPGISCGECEFCQRGEYNLCRFQAFKGIPSTQGCMTEFVAIPWRYAHKLPPQIDHEEGTVIEPLAVALQGLAEGQVRAGQSVAILGGGTIGLMALQAALALGAGPVIVVDLYTKRLDLAKNLGAAHVVNACIEDPVHRILELTNQLGTDVVLETSGTAAAAAQTVRIVRRGGTVVLVGVGAGEVSFNVDLITRSRLKLTGTFRYANQFPVALSLAKSGKVDLCSIITHRFPLERTQEALEISKSQRDSTIKTLVTL
ncbi:sorbitol dehydrogenase [Peptococcaceae bacterium CEB3]|nr:sorbitol dehydrogenase [Peptococcaceae bacterium CEB3]